MTMLLNPNIPEAVRAVASNPTQLRYTLMEMAAKLPNAIALGRGDPDFATPPHIVAAAELAIRDQRTGLTPVAGLPELRAGIAAKLRRDNQLDVEADNVIVTTGGQEGVFLMMQAFLEPGDEVIVPDPRYPSYDEAIEKAGGVMVIVPTEHDDAFNLRPEVVEAAITPRTKAILIITPGNPTSGIVTEERLRAIAEIAIRHNLIVVSDEIYEKYIYDDWKHFSIGSLPGMAERTVTLNGFSKSYAMTGFRVGYVAASTDVINAMIHVKHYTSGPAATVAQLAALEAITGPQACVAEFLRIFTERRAVMMAGLRDMRLNLSDPRGAFYIWADSSSTGIHATELSYLLLNEAGVLIFPGNGFGENWSGYLRMSLLQPVDLLREALDRMRPVIERYRQ